ncbi:MAG: nicotinate-nucleotide--dimethylbenzimidazole phosphoribosyltransferase [Kordiimonas sp.]
MSAPFDDLRRVLAQLPEGDTCAAKKVIGGDEVPDDNQADGLLGLKQWLATWQGTSSPQTSEAHICVLASCYAGSDSAVVKEFIDAASRGSAPVNRLCVDKGVGLRVLELAPDLPYDLSSPWDQAECMAAVAFGMEATASGGSLLGLSDYAPGNYIPALKVISFLGGFDVTKLEEHLEDKTIGVLIDFVEANGGQGTDPLEVLRLYGGREVAASVGAIIAARSRRLPVVVDGWSALAAIAVLEAEKAGSTDHVKVASCPDYASEWLAEKVGKKPLLGFSIASGSGCGNAISVALLKAAVDL